MTSFSVVNRIFVASVCFVLCIALFAGLSFAMEAPASDQKQTPPAQQQKQIKQQTSGAKREKKAAPVKPKKDQQQKKREKQPAKKKTDEKKVASSDKKIKGPQPPYSMRDFAMAIRNARKRIKGYSVGGEVPEAVMIDGIPTVVMAKGYVFSLGPLNDKNKSSTLILDVQSGDTKSGAEVLHGILTIAMMTDPARATEIVDASYELCAPGNARDAVFGSWQYSCVSRMDPETHDAFLSFRAMPISQ